MEQEERFERIEEQQKEFVKRLEDIERQTEPIKVTRVEIDTGGIQERLAENNKLLRGIAQAQADHSERFDMLERSQQELMQELQAHSTAWLETLQENFDETKAVLIEIGTKQADHSERFDEVKVGVNDIKATMATKDEMAALKADHGAKLDMILQLLQQRSGN